MKKALNFNFFNWSGRNVFTERLTTSDIQEFLEKTYSINVISVERVESRITNFINFKIIGRYLHAGFNDVSFDGVFYASDTTYFFDTIVEKFQKNYPDLWENFLIKKFGEEYFK